MAKNEPPTPAEIRQRCQEIQSEWSEAERWARMRSDWRATFRRVDGEQIEFQPEVYAAHIEGQVSPEPEHDEFDEPAD